MYVTESELADFERRFKQSIRIGIAMLFCISLVVALVLTTAPSIGFGALACAPMLVSAILAVGNIRRGRNGLKAVREIRKHE